MMIKKINILATFLLFPLFIFIGCDFATKPPESNMAPNTSITNIPVENDTLFPLIRIIWDGGDNDGFIIGCEYRFTTYHLSLGDSSQSEWFFTADQEIDIIFESSDSLNKQILEVRAMDNDSLVDPTPARLILYTPRTILPVTNIIQPRNNSKYYYLDETNDWWQGIDLIFTASDEDGEILEYGYSIDGSELFWTSDTALLITKEFFSEPLVGSHTIKVVAKDNTNLIDPEGDFIQFNLIKPTFSKKLLIIDETDETQFPRSDIKRNDAYIDSLYADFFQPDSVIDYFKSGFPDKEVLGEYKIILWHADHSISSDPHNLPQHTVAIEDYLNVGGNMIISSWQMLGSFYYGEPFPKTYDDDSFVKEYLHINIADQVTGAGDFLGASSEFGYSSVHIDPNLVPGFPYVGKLNNINIISESGSFTKAIYSYIANDWTSPYRTLSCGQRYFGTDYHIFFLGFPLSFLYEDEARTMAIEILDSFE